MIETMLLYSIGILFYILFGYLFVLFAMAGREEVPPRWVAIDLFCWPVWLIVFGFYGLYSLFVMLIFNQWPDERKKLLSMREKVSAKKQPSKGLLRSLCYKRCKAKRENQTVRPTGDGEEGS